MTAPRILFACIVTLLLASCSVFNPKEEPRYGTTLAELERIEMPEEPMPVPITSIEAIEDSYRSALEVASDPSVRHRILTRLADLEMINSEERQLNVMEEKAFFTDAIDMYNELLVLNAARQNEPDTPSNERLLYQLSKAYSLDGELNMSDEILTRLITQFPESGFAAEAEFRRAEKAFSEGDYDLAETIYKEVIGKGQDTPFYDNAVYMLGWSQFKRARYRASIKSFTEVLDHTLIEGASMADLSNTRRNMAKDTLRIISIAFSYQDGAQTITDIYNKLGLRHYKHLLYMSLGDLYLEKRRFRDSADTYRHYVQHFPNTDPAPALSVKAIEVYDLGGFPSLILPAKEEYIVSYGIYSQFWKDRNDTQREEIKANLALYLEELSSFYHSQALGLRKALADYKKDRAAGKKWDKKPFPAKPEFIKAAELYNQFVVTFPEHKKAPEMAYLMGEAYYEADQLEPAVLAYEMVAYHYKDKKRGAEAAHSVVVTLNDLVKQTTPSGKARKKNAKLKIKNENWRKKKVERAIDFADNYSKDPRAVPVLTKAAQEVFERSDFEHAVVLATRVTQWQPKPEATLYKIAWLILAHSQFDLEYYAEAESAYRTALTLLGTKDNERSKVIERIAASIFKLSEKQVASGEKAQAIERLLSIRDIAPGSDIALSGQYDAANYLMDLKDWTRAEAELLDFKKRYPKHKFIATLPAKFAFIYQASEEWAKAAKVLNGMAKTGDTEELRRQSLYLSAELYEKAKDLKNALYQYRLYANTYSKPFDLATEARFHLVELYGKTGDDIKRNFWLKRLIKEDGAAGDARTERSKYLAAFASIKFANDEFNQYRRIKIKLPLKRSLKKKRIALDKTLKSYRRVLGYGIAEFATEANHRIGNIYKQLSADLMASQRPKGMDELALEQYEVLLEEQAFPFEEKAIDLLSANAARTHEGIYDDWVKASFKALAELLPARYGKKERVLEFSDALY
ncbi:MAG: Clp protease ClpB [Alteromonadaceae bacterium]|nr:MAG: Clp protease ClpB [Alteromonadaceae bacterium]